MHIGTFAQNPHFSQMVRRATQLLTDAGTWLARPIAFLVVLAFVAVWLVFDRKSFNWHEVLTLATLCMTLFIQRSEHRDMQAVHAKLDELLRVHDEARELSRLDDKEPEQVEAFRDKVQAKE
jgi:low affinity Fe/Cu permease